MIHFHRLLVFLLWMLVIATWRVAFHLTVFHEEVTQALLCSLWKCTLNSRMLLLPFLHVEGSASQLHLITSEKVFVTIWSPCRNHWVPHNEPIGVHLLVKGQGLGWEVSALTIDSLPHLGSGGWLQGWSNLAVHRTHLTSASVWAFSLLHWYSFQMCSSSANHPWHPLNNRCRFLFFLPNIQVWLWKVYTLRYNHIGHKSDFKFGLIYSTNIYWPTVRWAIWMDIRVGNTSSFFIRNKSLCWR